MIKVGFVLKKNPEEFKAAEVGTYDWKVARQEVLDVFGGPRQVIRCFALIQGSKKDNKAA